MFKLEIQNVNHCVSKIVGVDNDNMRRFCAFLIKGNASSNDLLDVTSVKLEDYSVLLHDEFFEILTEKLGKKPESIICFEDHWPKSSKQTWWVETDAIRYLMETVKADAIAYLTDGLGNSFIEVVLKDFGDFFDVGQTGILVKAL